jgi:hypothetical protein
VNTTVTAKTSRHRDNASLRARAVKSEMVVTGTMTNAPAIVCGRGGNVPKPSTVATRP